MRKRRSFQHPLGRRELPQPLSPERLRRFYDFLRHSKVAKNREIAAHRIVMSHVRLGMAIVGNFAVFFPTKTDLFVAEMLYMLTYGVSLISNGAIDHHEGEPNITGYLALSVQKHLQKVIDLDRVIIGAGYAKGKRSIVVALNGREPEQKKGGNQELMELILSVAVTPLEVEIIRMRAKGHDDQEIAKCLGVSRQLIGMKRSELREKVNKALQ